MVFFWKRGILNRELFQDSVRHTTRKEVQYEKMDDAGRGPGTADGHDRLRRQFDKENADSSEVALDSFFYAGLAEEYHWTEDAAASEADELLLSNIEGEMLDSTTPG